jgi:hypothetical protein
MSETEWFEVTSPNTKNKHRKYIHNVVVVIKQEFLNLLGDMRRKMISCLANELRTFDKDCITVQKMTAESSKSMNPYISAGKWMIIKKYSSALDLNRFNEEFIIGDVGSFFYGDINQTICHRYKEQRDGIIAFKGDTASGSEMVMPDWVEGKIVMVLDDCGKTEAKKYVEENFEILIKK